MWRLDVAAQADVWLVCGGWGACFCVLVCGVLVWRHAREMCAATTVAWVGSGGGGAGQQMFGHGGETWGCDHTMTTPQQEDDNKHAGREFHSWQNAHSQLGAQGTSLTLPRQINCQEPERKATSHAPWEGSAAEK